MQMHAAAVAARCAVRRARHRRARGYRCRDSRSPAAEERVQEADRRRAGHATQRDSRCHVRVRTNRQASFAHRAAQSSARSCALPVRGVKHVGESLRETPRESVCDSRVASDLSATGVRRRLGDQHPCRRRHCTATCNFAFCAELTRFVPSPPHRKLMIARFAS